MFLNREIKHSHDIPLLVSKSPNKTLQHEHDVFAIFDIVQ